jgi:DNA (cytosine-5)-methyltransferase 1
MKHLALFTGVNGFGIAAEWAGFETIGFSEIDPYCCKLLAEKYPEIPNYGDIRTADFSELRGRIDVLSAGVPCQPSSLAGKRRGASDERWLWPATLDVVGCVKPAWAIFENPPGIASLREFNGVLLCLGDLGYEIRLFSVPANAVGAKHRRQRVFIVANADHTERRPAQPGGNEHHGPETGWGQSTDRYSGICDQDVADTNSDDEYRGAGNVQMGRQRSEESVARDFHSGGNQWLTESPLCRATDGVSHRSHRLKALGNAVVPQQAYPFFAAIAQTEKMIC